MCLLLAEIPERYTIITSSKTRMYIPYRTHDTISSDNYLNIQ